MMEIMIVIRSKAVLGSNSQEKFLFIEKQKTGAFCIQRQKVQNLEVVFKYSKITCLTITSAVF